MPTISVLSEAMSTKWEFRGVSSAFSMKNSNHEFRTYSLDSISFVLFLGGCFISPLPQSTDLITRLGKQPRDMCPTGTPSLWECLERKNSFREGIAEVLTLSGMTRLNHVVYSPLPLGGKDLCWNFLAFLPPKRTKQSTHKSEWGSVMDR